MPSPQEELARAKTGLEAVDAATTQAGAGVSGVATRIANILKQLKDALENFADRLALDEAHAFATLINQSIDLGSSITDAMRVYSDDMRHKRLSRAEEKAYALPAKLAVPMMACIFPVLFVVILLPVFVRLHAGHYF